MGFYRHYQAWTQQRHHRVWDHNPKLAGRDLAKSLGIPVPALHGLANGPEGVARIMSGVSGAFVLKPNQGSTTRGVQPLRRDGDGFRSLWTGEVDTAEGWAARMHEHCTRDKSGHSDSARRPWLVEQCITGPDGSAADDIRVYAIRGTVAWVHRSRRQGRLARYYANWTRDGEALPMGQVDYSTKLPGRDPADLPRPVWFRDNIDAAERVARDTGADFLRVDFYEDAESHYFGELTPCPGPLNRQLIRFGKELDAAMAEMWG